MAEGNVITSADLGLDNEIENPMLNLRQVREIAEKQAVVRVLGRAGGNLSKAAEMLGISRPTLYELLDRFELRSSVVRDAN
jgi:two-component system NtrC family response regulator